MSTQASPAAPVRIRHEALWMFVGQMAVALSQWGILAFGAKQVGPEMLGRYGLAAAILGPIALLASMNLRVLLATDVESRWRFVDYLRLRMAGIAAATGASLLLTPLVSRDPIVWVIVAILLVQKGLEGASELHYGLFQRAHQAPLIGRSLLGRAVLALLAFAVILGITDSFVAALGAQTIACAALAWGHDRPQAVRMGLREARVADVGKLQADDRARVRELLRLALPYSLLSLAPALMAAFPRWLLGRVDLGALGYFTALIYAPTALSLMMTALGQVLAPRLARGWVARDVRALRALLVRGAAVAAVLGAAAVLAVVLVGVPVVAWLYTPDYAIYNDELLLLTVAGCLQMISTTAGFALSAWRRIVDKRRQAVALIVGNIVLSGVLVPDHGFTGACWAVLLTAAAHCASNWWLVRRALRTLAAPAP